MRKERKRKIKESVFSFFIMKNESESVFIGASKRPNSITRLFGEVEVSILESNLGLYAPYKRSLITHFSLENECAGGGKY